MKMRKILLMTLLILACTMLSSCVFIYRPIRAWSTDRFSTFFSEETLESKGLEDFPIPNMQFSLLRDGVLYLRLTDEEYNDYVREVARYMREKDDIYHPSFVGDSEMKGLLFLVSHILYTAPLDDMYLDAYDSQEYTMLYSLDESSDGTFAQEDPQCIYISRESGGLDYTSFTYNARISFVNPWLFKSYSFDPCRIVHSFGEEEEYIVPGEDRTVMSADCIYCGADSISDPSNQDKCDIIPLRDEHLLYEYPTECMSDGICEIKVKPVDEGEIVVKIKGDVIPPSVQTDEYISYRFAATGKEAMPLIYHLKDGEPINKYLGDIYPWIFELEKEDIMRVSDHGMNSGTFINDLRSVVYSDNRGTINEYIKQIRYARLEEGESIPSERSPKILRIQTNDGDVYDADVSGGLAFDGEKYYNVEGIPSITGKTGAKKQFFFDTETGVGDLYLCIEDGKQKIAELDCINSFLFSSCNGTEYEDEMHRYIISTDAGDIFVITESVFYMIDGNGRRNWFALEDMKFSQIFEMGSTDPAWRAL